MQHTFPMRVKTASKPWLKCQSEMAVNIRIMVASSNSSTDITCRWRRKRPVTSLRPPPGGTIAATNICNIQMTPVVVAVVAAVAVTVAVAVVVVVVILTFTFKHVVLHICFFAGWGKGSPKRQYQKMTEKYGGCKLQDQKIMERDIWIHAFCHFHHQL